MKKGGRWSRLASGLLIGVHFNCKTVRAREKRSSTAGGRLIGGSYSVGTTVVVKDIVYCIEEIKGIMNYSTRVQ